MSVVPVAVVARHDRDRVALHRHDRDALVLEPAADHDVGAGQRVGAPLAASAAEVGSERLDLDRGGRVQRGLRIDGDRQRVVVDDDRLGRVDRGGLGLRDDHRDGVADEVHRAAGERGPRARRVQLHERGDGGQREVVGREDGDDAGHRQRVGRVDRADGGVGDRRTDERELQRAVDRQVVDVGGAAGQEIGVLDAPDGVSEQ